MRFALFLKNLDEEYQISIYRGVKSEIEAMGIDLMCVQSGGSRHYEISETELFPAHEFIAADGIMLLSTALFDRIDADFISGLRNIFPDLPIVSIGVSLEGYPSIVIDSRNTMKALMEHLTGFHDYSDLLYIGGPAEHEDNKIRESIFREHILSLSSQIPPVSGDIINTQFHETAGMTALRGYIAESKGKPPQVIVCGNDYIAMGALKTISSQSDPIWHNCTVTGFDDIDQAKFAVPALTTIRQPLEDLGKIAVQTLAALVKGEHIDPVIKVDSHLIIRNSCGCSDYYPEIDLKEIPNGTRQEQQLRNMFIFAQNLGTITSRKDIIPHLTFLLTNLNIKTFYLVTYKEPQDRLGLSQDDELLYCRIGGKDFSYAENPQPIDIKYFFKTQITEDLPYIDLKNISEVKSQSRAWCLYPLRSQDEYLGYLLYEVQDNIHLQICSAAVFITNTLRRLRILENEKERARRLEAEVLRISDVERLRFSLDLHDDICQRLAGISMFCKSLSAGQSPESFMPELSGMIEETMQRTRQYAQNSFPVELDSFGLKESLAALCRAVDQQGMNCIYTWDITGPVPLSQIQNINVYRIIQEALQNAVKHSHANRLNVDISAKNGVFVASVKDNGQGNPLLNGENPVLTVNSRREGLGLRSMRYRAHQIGAEYIFESTEDSGTTVELRIPCQLCD